MKYINIDKYNSSIFIDQNYNSFSMIGDDAISFLDRMSTNNIFKINSSRTAITDNKGSVIDILTYKVINEKKIIFVSDIKTDRSIEYMKKYIIIDDVEIKHNGNLSKIVIYSKKSENSIDLENFSLISTYEYKEFMRYELFSSDDELKKFNKTDYKHISIDEKNTLDIQMRYIGIKESMIKANPLELGLLDIISFDKGCYVGQEVIARLHNYKKVSRELVPFSTKSELEINSKIIIDSKNIGNVLSIHKKADGFLGLSLIKKRFSYLLTEEIIKI
tara:strand:+ start:35302 stop:36126 length:825 start_codon:yes stop_codon:yes gene_type:complete